jgi:hypothetical protein
MATRTWMPLGTQADLDKLLELFGGFHDGCIREAHVWTETYVHPNLSMTCPGHLDNRVRLFVQRQFEAPSAIELLFEQVTTFHLLPSPDNYDSIIFGATMVHENDLSYWADSEGWSPAAPDRDKSTWIAAKKYRGVM